MAKLVRYRDADGAESYGRIEGDLIHPLTGELSALLPLAGASPVPMTTVRLIAPATPSKIVAVGPNYKAHLGGYPPPPRPYYWIKPATAVLDPDGCVVIPDFVPMACHESELAVIIARRARNISREEAAAHIFGYTCIDDVTAGNLPAREEFARSQEFVDGKTFDTFAPIGPVVATGIDPSDLLIECRINGETRQHHRTSDMIFHPHELVAMISKVMTLLPGDIVATGSPPGMGKLFNGDVVEIEIESVGLLRHTVSAPN